MRGSVKRRKVNQSPNCFKSTEIKFQKYGVDWKGELLNC